MISEIMLMLVAFLSVIMTLLNYRADTSPGLVGLKGFPGFAGFDATGPVGDQGPIGPTGSSAIGFKVGPSGPIGDSTTGTEGPTGPSMSEAPTIWLSTSTPAASVASGDLTFTQSNLISLTRVQGFKSTDDGLTWSPTVLPFQITKWASNGKTIIGVNNSSKVVSGESLRVAYSFDCGSTWYSVNYQTNPIAIVNSILVTSLNNIQQFLFTYCSVGGGVNGYMYVLVSTGNFKPGNYTQIPGEAGVFPAIPGEPVFYGSNHPSIYYTSVQLNDGPAYLATNVGLGNYAYDHYKFFDFPGWTNHDPGNYIPKSMLGEPRCLIEHTGLPLFLMNGGLCRLLDLTAQDNTDAITKKYKINSSTTVINTSLESMASNGTEILIVGTIRYFYIAMYDFGQPIISATTFTQYNIPGLIRAYNPMWTGANFVVCAQVASGRSAVHTTYVINIDGSYTRSNVLSDTELGQPWCPNIWQTRPSNDDLLTTLLA